jgi:ecotin
MRVLARALLLVGLAAAPAPAVPRLDLSSLPRPAAGERRWVIQLPGVLRPEAASSVSADPADWRVQVIVGQTVLLDCNRQSFSGRLEPQPATAALGPLWHRVRQVGPLVSTRMACPPDQPRRAGFVPMAAEPLLLPYAVSQPIVVDAPPPLQVRWRLWKAERQERAASPLR